MNRSGAAPDQSWVLYRFGEFELDTRHRMLRSRADGRALALKPKVFDTLLYFVEHRAELLDRRRLMKAIWSDTIVDENNLTQNISVLRQMLGESPDQHRFIVTVPGRGYRFVAEVSMISPAGPARGPVALAVLPFTNLTGDPAKEYFGDGIAEELIHALCRVRRLKIPARTSSFMYKTRSIDVRDIARELGVDLIVEGSVRAASDRVRVTAQVVDGNTGYHVWSQNYDRSFVDLFALQDAIADEIVQAIGMLTETSKAPLEHAHAMAIDVEAYRWFLQARSLSQRGDEQSLRRAVDLFNHVLARGPSFARAHSALALTYGLFPVLGLDYPQALGLSERHAREALELDSSQSEAHSALGQVHALRCEWLKADVCLRTAAMLDPSDAYLQTQHAMIVSASTGHLRQAHGEMLEAHRMAPANPLILVRLASVCDFRQIDEEAQSYAEMAVALGYPATLYPIPHIKAGIACRAGHHHQAAQLMCTAMSMAAATNASDAIKLLYEAIGGSAQRSIALAALRDLQVASSDTASAHFMLWMMSAYAMLNELDESFAVAAELLRRLENGGALGNLQPLWVPELSSLRRDPRFQTIARQLGLSEYWKKAGLPDEARP